MRRGAIDLVMLIRRLAGLVGLVSRKWVSFNSPLLGKPKKVRTINRELIATDPGQANFKVLPTDTRTAADDTQILMIRNPT